MSRRAPKISFPDPFLGWGALAYKTAEMMAASALVIPHRSSRPNTPAQIFAMGSEKMQAALEASNAMTLQWLRMGKTPSMSDWAAFYASGVTPFHRRAVSNARRARRA